MRLVDWPRSLSAGAIVNGSRRTRKIWDCESARVLADAIPARLAEIVHEADIGDERYAAPEAPGLDAIVRCILLLGDDFQTLEQTAPIFDALARMARHNEDGGANTQI